MADVDINKFRASVVREGSKPASPGFIVSEGQSPTDPAGSGQNHLPVTITPEATGLSITESQVLGGAGTVGQYIRGDGSLADFPESSGGGSSVSYYLNGSVAQGTIGGVAYKELNKVPILGAGTDFTINADGYIASFITDAGDPNLLEIPGGNWNFETYFSASSGGGSPTFYVELYKVNSGGTATLIASNSTFPELIAFGTNIISYFSTLAVPTTALALTDRLAIRYYVTHSGRTITLHTEDNHLCQIVTTFTTGITALNGLTAQVQNFAVGTSGTDFAIASATATHTFNLPTASATNRGALSSADWTTFNNKTSNLGTVTSVGLSSATSGVTIGSSPVTTSGTITLAIATASGSQNGLLSSTDWTTFNGKQNALTNPVTGTGASGQVAYFTGTSAISSESNLFWDATNDRLGIGGLTTSYKLQITNSSSLGITISTVGSDSANPHIQMLNGAIDTTIAATSSGLELTAYSAHALLLKSSNVERFRIFALGNVHIGPTPASDNGARLQVSGTAIISSSLRSNSHIIVSDGTSNVVLQGYINNALRIAVSGSGSSGGSRGDLYAGLADFSSSVTCEVNNISADGAGVVLQGYVDNNLRIAVRGSGYNSGARGGLLASTGDFSSTIYAATLSQFGSAIAGQNVQLNINGVSGKAQRIEFQNSGVQQWLIGAGAASETSSFEIFNSTGVISLSINKSTNAATFSNSITAKTLTLADSAVIQVIESTTGTNFNGLEMKNSGGSFYFGQDNSAGNFYASGTAYSGCLYVSGNNPLVMFTSGTERMRINSVGYTKARANGGNYFGGGYHEFVNNNNVSGDICLVIGNRGGTNTNNTSSYHLIVADNGGDKLYIYGNGNVVNVNNAYGTLSDIALKENIKDATPKLEDILKLKVRNFNLIGSDEKQIGFVAQELEEIFPKMVDINGINQMKSIKTSVLVPMLVKAIQELKQEIDTLKN